MSKIVNIINMLMNDEIFLLSLKTNIDELSCNGYIEIYDIPYIILVIYEYTNNFSNYNLTHDELLDIWYNLTNDVLEHFNLIPDDEHDSYRYMIKSNIQLLLICPINKNKYVIKTCVDKILCCKKKEYEVNNIIKDRFINK